MRSLESESNTSLIFRPYNYYEKLIRRYLEEEIAIICIESIMQRQGWNAFDVSKCDIEGSETQLLASGVRGWIKKTNVIIIELHQSREPDCARLLFEAFSSVRFYLSWKGENLVIRKLENADGLVEDTL